MRSHDIDLRIDAGVSIETLLETEGRRPVRCPLLFSAFAATCLAFAATTSPQPVSAASTVAMVRSDDATLHEPIARDQRLDYHRHVLPMVQRVLEQSKLKDLVDAATTGTDGVVDVVCKVNIVHAEHVQGDVTDWRVVKAVVQTIHAWRPEVKLTIAEGGVWFPPERTDLHAMEPSTEIGDGFETAGYRALLTDPDLADVNLHIVDLNYDDTIEKTPPGGGLVAETYHVPRTVSDADLFIDMPVMKVTGAIGMTVAMKNLIGTAPGMKYGWSKSRGWPPDSGNPGLWHTSRTLDETLVDLTGVVEADFAVVDAIMCMERGRIIADGGMPTRRNIVFAGNDLVAVDAVATRLMGMNPLDMEYLQLGQRRGLGIADLDRVQLLGDLEDLTDRFHKYPMAWGEGHYGMGQRTWLLKGPIPTDEDEQTPIEPHTSPTPASDGWSSPVYFHDDKIDLDRYYNDPIHSVAYAYAEFDAPRDEDAEIWVGSDEGLVIFIDGEQVYEYGGRRRHKLPNDRIPITLTRGTHRVLVRAHQRRGEFDFSLKICEVEPDLRYDGNHVFGLTWHVPGEATHDVTEILVVGDNRSGRGEWYEAHEVDTTSPNRVFLKSILPWYGRAPWIRLEWPLMWGDEMELQANLNGSRLEVLSGNVQAFRLEPEGPLEGPRSDVELVVDGTSLGKLPNSRVRLARNDEGTWSMAVAEPLDWEKLGFIGEAVEALDRDHREGEFDSRLGNMFTDAALMATGADVAFQNNGGIRQDIEADFISIRDIFRINFPNDLYTFPLTGAELLEVLEFDARDGKPRPMQVGGMNYVVDRTLPEGQRIVASDIDPEETYTIISQAYLCDRAPRFFGREINATNTGIQTVESQIRLIQQTPRLRAPATGRIRVTVQDQ